MNTTSTIFLVRHAQAKTDPGKRYIGQTDLLLSKKGHQQAQALGEYFKDIPLDKIISSDLNRAQSTADIVAGRHNLPVETRKNLREIYLGEWENKRFDDIKRQYPGQFRSRGRHMDTFCPPGGESFKNLYDRVIPEFESLAAGLPQNTLIVAHAGVNRVILCHLLGMPLKNIFQIGQDPAGVNILTFRNSRLHVHRLNINAI